MTKMRDKILFYCSLISLFFIVQNIKASECGTTTTNGVRIECTASAPICSLPYTYQYDYTNQSDQSEWVFNDKFDNSTDDWLPLSATSNVSNDAARLKISKAGGSGALGVYKNFNAVVGKTYTLTATIDKGNCNPASSIQVNVKDAGGNVVATTSVSSGGISYINLQFTPATAGVYLVEFKRLGNNSSCSFFLDDIVLKYPNCTVNSLWHYFYLDANQIDLLIKDNFSGLVDAKLYGPFNQSESPQLICSGIISGSIPAVADGISISGNTVQLTTSNLTPGWYALEVNDNDCSGCIEITSPEGNISCAPPCPASNCESVQHLCDDYSFSTPCSCVVGTNQMWYSFDVLDLNQEVNIQYFINNNSSNLFNANYYLAGPIPENYSCDQTYLTNYLLSPTTFSGAFNQFQELGRYFIVITNACDQNSTNNATFNIDFTPTLDCSPILPPCENCIGSFKPIPGSKYVLGAWAKEDAAPLSKITYDRPKIIVHFYNASHQLMASSLQPFVPSGMIIDGWQRIEEEFIIPAMAAYVGIELIAEDGDVYFDDIRVFPFDASMKSYVYDPVNMRLVAELDERNYATFYEYDEEGKLTRIKKETERGIMTIQETRYNTSKP